MLKFISVVQRDESNDRRVPERWCSCRIRWFMTTCDGRQSVRYDFTNPIHQSQLKRILVDCFQKVTVNAQVRFQETRWGWLQTVQCCAADESLQTERVRIIFEMDYRVFRWVFCKQINRCGLDHARWASARVDRRPNVLPGFCSKVIVVELAYDQQMEMTADEKESVAESLVMFPMVMDSSARHAHQRFRERFGVHAVNDWSMYADQDRLWDGTSK